MKKEYCKLINFKNVEINFLYKKLTLSKTREIFETNKQELTPTEFDNFVDKFWNDFSHAKQYKSK